MRTSHSTPRRASTRLPEPVSASPAQGRLGYLDWLRGLTVLVMIEAHAFDAWTLPHEKARAAYGWLMVLGGMAAPAFLFMAGIAVALGAAAQMRRGRSPAEAARLVERRGWQIFLYAFLFRLQSYALGGFSNAAGLLKVDILNIMGPAIVAAACVWRLPGTRLRRALVLAAAAALISMSTPAIRDAGLAVGVAGPARVVFQARPRQGHFHPVSVGGVRPGGSGPGAGPGRGACAGRPGGSRRPSPLQASPSGRRPIGLSWQPAAFPERAVLDHLTGVLRARASGCWSSWSPWRGCGRSGHGRDSSTPDRWRCWASGRCLSTGSMSSWSMAEPRSSPAPAHPRAGAQWPGWLFTGGMYLLLLGWNHLGPARAKFRESFLNPLLSRA